MAGLWNAKKPLNQPPHFRRVGAQDLKTPECALEKAAQRAVSNAQFARDVATNRMGGRRATVRE